MSNAVQRTGRSGRWDTDAIKAGGGVCIVFAVPFQVLALLVGKTSSLATLLRVLALLGFLLGAGVAAWVQRKQLPLAHGIVTAIGAFAVVQVAFIIGRAIVGNDLRLGAAVANLAPVLGVGLLGGFLGQALQRGGLAPGMRGRALRDDHDPDIDLDQNHDEDGEQR